MADFGLVLTQGLNGLTIGLVYSLIALGLTIVLGLMGVINFSHGAFYMIGGYITYTVLSTFSGNFWIGIFVGALVSGVIGIALFFTIIKPLRKRPILEPMIALIGVAMIIEQLIRTIWGSEPKQLPIPFGRIEFNMMGYTFMYPIYFVIVMIISASLLVFFYYLFCKTDLGVRCLASIQDRETAMAMGVDVDQVGGLIFALGSAAAGFGGGLAGPIFSVYPTMGIELIGLIFTIVIVGGLGSIGGTVIASILIAMVTSISLLFVAGNVATIFAYIVMLIILVVRPRGLMGLKSVLE